MAIVTANDARRALRAQLLAMRSSMSGADKTACDERIVARLLAYIDAQTPAPRRIALYLPIRGEPDVRFLFEMLNVRGIEVLLPVVVEKNAPLGFAVFDDKTELHVGAYGILEPDLSQLTDAAPDLVVVPCVGFDAHNYRLGYGGGYYDRTLAGWAAQGAAVKTVGVAYQYAQVVFEIHAYDLPLDEVLTDA